MFKQGSFQHEIAEEPRPSHSQNPTLFSGLVAALLALALALTTSTSLAQEDDSAEQEEFDQNTIDVLKGVHLTATVTSFLPDPFTAFAADNIAFATNIALK